MPLRSIMRIVDCKNCIEKELSVAEVQLLAQQQDLHTIRHRRRQQDQSPLV